MCKRSLGNGPPQGPVEEVPSEERQKEGGDAPPGAGKGSKRAVRRRQSSLGQPTSSNSHRPRRARADESAAGREPSRNEPGSYGGGGQGRASVST